MADKNKKKLEPLVKFFKEKGLTQEDIAARLCVSQAHVNQLLNGKTLFGKKTAAKWADVFGISAAWLLTGDGKMLTNDKKENNYLSDTANLNQETSEDAKTLGFISLLKKKDEQIDRLITLLEQSQKK